MSAAIPLAPVPFELQPFGGDAERAGLGLEGMRLSGKAAVEHGADGAILCIDYALVGDLGERPTALLLPPPAEQPNRRDGLWEHTCLEAFVSASAREPYWELNLAPSGDWAVYRFDGYRHGQQSPPLEAPPFAMSARPDGLELQLRWPLPAELAAASALSLGITAVLEQRNGAISYWALHHPAPAADFHRREGFRLQL
jgi:hypothetical protein